MDITQRSTALQALARNHQVGDVGATGQGVETAREVQHKQLAWLDAKGCAGKIAALSARAVDLQQHMVELISMNAPCATTQTLRIKHSRAEHQVPQVVGLDLRMKISRRLAPREYLRLEHHPDALSPRLKTIRAGQFAGAEATDRQLL